MTSCFLAAKAALLPSRVLFPGILIAVLSMIEITMGKFEFYRLERRRRGKNLSCGPLFKRETPEYPQNFQFRQHCN